MSGPVLVFRNPRPPRRQPQLPRGADKFSRLHALDPVIARMVEELIDDMLREYKQLGQDQPEGA